MKLASTQSHLHTSLRLSIYSDCYSIPYSRCALLWFVQVQNNNSLSDNDFELFFDELREEAAEMGEENVSEEEARELWAMMNDEFDDSMLMNEGDSVPDSVDEEMDRRLRKFDPSSHTGGEQLEVLDGNKLESRTSGLTRIETNNRTLADEQKQGCGKIVEGLQRDCNLGETDDDNDSEIVGLQKQHDTLKNQAERLAVQHTAQQNSASFKSATQTSVVTYDSEYDAESSKDDFAQEEGSVIESSSEKPYAASPLISESVEIVSQDKEEDDPKFHELRELLPALSDQRLKRILKVFKQNLGNPPLLELVPIVRENMPDYITNTWLKKMSALTANYVVQKAAEDHLVDRHILNGVLEIETSHGSLDRALDFHQTEFSRHQLQPTNYSDRLVLQMFLKNKRLSRALSFKQKVEASGRTLDLKAYGSLIDYCSRRKQIGSAMLLLKECTRIHGAPPGEAMLKQFRSVCRKNGLNEKFAVKELIGDDPFEWIREGKKLRRNRSKESNRKARESRSIVVRL